MNRARHPDGTDTGPYSVEFPVRLRHKMRGLREGAEHVGPDPTCYCAKEKRFSGQNKSCANQDTSQGGGVSSGDCGKETSNHLFY